MKAEEGSTVVGGMTEKELVIRCHDPLAKLLIWTGGLASGEEIWATAGVRLSHHLRCLKNISVASSLNAMEGLACVW